jgi:hypothetical protein
MKRQIFLFLLLFISINLFSQSALEKHFLNRWNEYRTSISLNPVSCQLQHWKVGIAYKDYDVLVYSINEKKDTIYKKEICRGNKKYIPKFHDKNTSKILEAKHLTLFDTITESPICNIIKTEEDYFKCMDYMDSVRANILFKELLQSKENETILSSNYNFYLDISSDYSPSDSCIVYKVQLFEIIENTDLSISSDYDSFILNGNFEKLKPFIVDEVTKKRKYRD